MPSIDLEKLERFIQDLYEQYQREEEQAIMQRNMDKAVAALCGKEACIRLKNNLGMRVEMDNNVVRMQRSKRGT
jgi:hypothetical protein